MNRITRTAGRFLCFVMLAGLLAPDAGALPPVPVLWVDASTLTAGSFNAATTPVNNLGTRGGTFNTGTYSVNATGINGKPALQFNGTSNYIESLNAYANSGTTLTLFIVENRITGTDYQRAVSCVNPAAGADHSDVRCFTVAQNDATTYRVERGGAWPGAQITHPGNAVPFIWESVFDNVNVKNYLVTASSSLTASNASSGNFDCSKTRLAAHAHEPIGDWANINIGEVLIYNTALSDTDRLAVQSYLQAKWGIGAGIPGGPPWIPGWGQGSVLIVR